MRLTDVLLGVFKRRGFGGPRFHFVKSERPRGKYRATPPVTSTMKIELWKKLAIEEQAMMYLSRPFLTTASGFAYLCLMLW
ncbi:hypothetical protein MTO96_022256 [Rhipicephalus appendiculatus]